MSAHSMQAAAVEQSRDVGREAGSLADGPRKQRHGPTTPSLPSALRTPRTAPVLINDRGRDGPRWKPGFAWFDRFKVGSPQSHAAIIAFNSVVMQAEHYLREGDVFSARYAAKKARAILVGFGRQVRRRGVAR